MIDGDGRFCRLEHAEALDLVTSLPPDSVDLAYVDPPFFTGRDHGAFDDRWPDGLASFVGALVERLAPLVTRLTPSGSLYVHLDWRTVHHVKVALDDVFGAASFLNEIIWSYGLGGSGKRWWPRKHDTILWYVRDPSQHWFEAPRVPARSRRLAGQDKKAPDVWDIPAINNMARERTGYPTQKPLALLERIVASSCPPGGVVLDPYCGSGTTCEAAERLGRSWIAGDRSAEAIATTKRRLAAVHGSG
ncbi:MAG: site-specific DNA-methyltransferase [Planctomycetota bacterium]